MNDAFRGLVIGLALLAFYFALRLAVAYLIARFGKREARAYVKWHVLWMSVGLLFTTTLVSATLIGDAGTNQPITWEDVLRLLQASAITAGLKPIWHEYQRNTDRRKARKGTDVPAI